STNNLAQKNRTETSSLELRQRAMEQKFEVGDTVMLFLPLEHSNLQVSRRDPFSVTGKKGGQNYRIQVGDKELYHVNVFKRLRKRETPNEFVIATVVTE
ncbi:hypothetical protein ACJMK2_030996, partial [Sinanodonta woodiana]